MHACTLRRLVIPLAVSVLCTGFASAWGQNLSGDPAHAMAGRSAYAMADQPVTASGYGAAAPGLENRVAELETAFGKIKSKEAAAKKKATGRPSIKVGGRIYWDWMANSQDLIGFQQVNQPDGCEFRRARIFVQGNAFHVVDYRIEMDFADTDTVGAQTIQSTAFKDVFIAIRELPYVGHVRVGHFKEPISLEQLTSTKFITFMERSICDEGMFTPGRNSGVMLHNYTENKRATWAIGGFVSEQSAGPPLYRTDLRGGLACTARATWLPWYDEATDGRGLLHLGAGYTYRDLADNSLRFTMRPEAHLANYAIDFTLNDVPNWQVFILETALVYGPFSAQAEYFNSYVTRTASANPMFEGMYVYFSYFLTGENRVYNRHYGAFNRVKPFENFFRVRAEDGCVYTGKGAWEVGYRFSYLDTNRAGVNGGILADHTIGLNWYLNPYTRLMFNYVNAELSNGLGRGCTDLVEMRCQVDF